MSKYYVYTNDDDDSDICVICEQPLSKNHKCSKEGESNFNRKWNKEPSIYTRRILNRYGIGFSLSEKLRDAFTVFGADLYT
ncbi:MAG: hypothetical protein A2Y12_00215 [Planctomycetes bacterium GWF2_42_9]|nr:MAG: hypothetical protein A2Y12_00215 [Planctomycetes bacterium GWF2_42_9]